MYIVENRVFYTSAKFNLDENIIESNKSLFDNISSSIHISYSSYWFNRFYSDNEYISFTFDRNDQEFFNKYFNENTSVDSLIEKIIIKTHPNGISSSEVFFFTNDNILKFDDYLDEFSTFYSKSIFQIVYEINNVLKDLNLLNFPLNYQYGVFINQENKIHNLLFKYFKSPVTINPYLEIMEDSYLLRVHLFTDSSTKYLEIKDFYRQNDIKSIDCSTKIGQNKFSSTLYWAFVLWDTDKIDIDLISQLMDIDSYTMNEIVIYNVAGDTYTNLMYSVDFESNDNLNSIELFEMYKINSYFIQKNKLNELSFNEDVNNFVTYQREIEKFQMQQTTYENSEKKYLEIYNAVEMNEKSKANQIIQYILMALTLLTIVSVVNDTIDFIKAEFLHEEVSFKIDIFSRSDFLILLLVFILFLFLKLRQYIKKM